MDRRWETEALRESMARRTGPPRPSQRRTAADDFVTLREAEAATGIPLNTIRKWARRGTIDSHLEEVGDVTLRMVSLASVRRRAASLGRSVDAGPPPAPPSEAEPAAPPGTMLVPVDAWNKILGQLGNLHEAGRELAEARERAAKAETEARFLRERLAELRAELTRARTEQGPPPVSDEAEPAEAPPPGGAPVPPKTEPLWRVVVRGFRRR